MCGIKARLRVAIVPLRNCVQYLVVCLAHQAIELLSHPNTDLEAPRGRRIEKTPCFGAARFLVFTEKFGIEGLHHDSCWVAEVV